MLRRCLAEGCTALTDKSRCATHRQDQRAKYKGDWPAHSRAEIAQHIMRYGYICPGWKTEPHASVDLTLDHDDIVLCRACNTRKRNLGDH